MDKKKGQKAYNVFENFQITFNTDGNNNVCYDTIKTDENNEVVLLTSCAIQVKYVFFFYFVSDCRYMHAFLW